ncbi:hypothetical protein WME98_45005 [Sorangium sp. So ce296]|uniref:hypothetical protein n=1 Tax=Sorangium sp. So ce296 TaxID=3133296 RepID=UPI003F5FFD11
MAELFGSADLIGRLQGMMSDLETRAEHAQAQAEQAMLGLREALLAALGSPVILLERPISPVAV